MEKTRNRSFTSAAEGGGEDHWGVALVLATSAVFVLLGAGLCHAAGGALREAEAELARQRAAAERLLQKLEATSPHLPASPHISLRR